MTKIFVFPGQGAQYKGMGADLFSKYPELVQQADRILGYSIVDLCLHDPDGLLDQTEFTQPAIYVVNALAYYDAVAQGKSASYLAGHSLGEFNALLAAGAFDFETGLKIVHQRGQIMGRVKGGGMAAMLGFSSAEILDYIRQHQLKTIEIANFNSADQTIISGSNEDLDKLEAIVEDEHGRCLRLNVSAAFHSRFMDDSQKLFQSYIDSQALEFSPLKIPVISNLTADLYPERDYQANFLQQLNSPVNWYQSISNLVACTKKVDIVELGPGFVLTRMCEKIVENPLVVDVAQLPERWKAEHERIHQVKTLFMFSGQGSQYYQMGKQLFEQDAVFRQAMLQCDGIFQSITGDSLVEELYQRREKSEDFSDVYFTHPAIFCFGYCLSKTLISRGLEPDAVLGYSLGEFVAAVVAGVLSLTEALTAIVAQSNALKNKADFGGMLTVLAPSEHYADNPDVYSDVELASVNYQGNFVVSGERRHLEAVQSRLNALGILTAMLPVNHGFHSSQIQSIQDDFYTSMYDFSFNEAILPFYSAATASEISYPDAHHFWKATREAVYFEDAIKSIQRQGRWRFVDLSATGTLSTFIKYGFASSDFYYAASPYGNDIKTIDSLFDHISLAS